MSAWPSSLDALSMSPSEPTKFIIDLSVNLMSLGSHFIHLTQAELNSVVYLLLMKYELPCVVLYNQKYRV